MNFFKKNIIFFLFVIKRFHGENINNYLLYITLVFVLKSHSKKSFRIVPNERFLGLAFRKSEVMFFVSPSKKRDAFISVRDATDKVRLKVGGLMWQAAKMLHSLSVQALKDRGGEKISNRSSGHGIKKK